MLADLLASAGLLAAAYELFAVSGRKVPTITDLVNRTPAWLRWSGLATAVVLALDHFRLLDLF